jgi:hypothetical protein
LALCKRLAKAIIATANESKAAVTIIKIADIGAKGILINAARITERRIRAAF